MEVGIHEVHPCSSPVCVRLRGVRTHGPCQFACSVSPKHVCVCALHVEDAVQGALDWSEKGHTASQEPKRSLPPPAKSWSS